MNQCSMPKEGNKGWVEVSWLTQDVDVRFAGAIFLSNLWASETFDLSIRFYERKISFEERLS